MMANQSEAPEPQVMVFGRRRGRPRVTPGESSTLSVRIWSEHHEALVEQARAKNMEFPDYVRSILAKAAKR